MSRGNHYLRVGNDPWAGGEGTVDMSQVTASSTATALTSPIAALASVFGGIKNIIAPSPSPTVARPVAQKSYVLPIVLAAGVVGAFILVARRAS